MKAFLPFCNKKEGSLCRMNRWRFGLRWQRTGAQTLEQGLRAVCPAVEVRRVEPAALACARIHGLLWDVDGIAAAGGMDGVEGMGGRRPLRAAAGHSVSRPGCGICGGGSGLYTRRAGAGG